ncbi:MAG: hypothetical protein IPJ58_07955 [Ardenticatenia bacterium]|nr:hypothetical protein [Ardenticatenia bacterium]
MSREKGGRKPFGIIALGLILTIAVVGVLYRNGVNRDSIQLPPAPATPFERGAPGFGSPLTEPRATTVPAMMVDGQRVAYLEFDDHMSNVLEDDPSVSRTQACQETVDHFERYYLLWQARKRGTSQINEATAIAEVAAHLTESAADPNLAPMQVEFGTPDVDELTYFARLAMKDAAFQDSVYAKAPTPSHDEIEREIALNGLTGPLFISLARIDYESSVELKAIWEDLTTDGSELEEGELGGRFLERAQAARNLSSSLDAAEVYEYEYGAPLPEDIPDYAVRAIEDGWTPGAMAPFERPDGSGAVVLVLSRVDQRDYLQGVEERLLKARRDQAMDTYVAQLKASATVEVLVDCSTHQPAIDTWAPSKVPGFVSPTGDTDVPSPTNSQ